MAQQLAVPKTELEAFKRKVEATVLQHPIVLRNRFAEWFAKGEADLATVRHFTQQFSVFSHQFIIAQLQKVINSADLASYRMGKEILLNELGVVFRKPGVNAAKNDSIDPNIVGVEGTVDGATYRHAAGHFEWLVNFAAPLGLTFRDLGRKALGTRATNHFCEELIRIYGSPDPSTSSGASFAIENWAAAGFWKQLIAGLTAFKEKTGSPLNLGFWVFHDKLEDQHAEHTEDELEEDFGAPWFDEERYLAGAREVLAAVESFWEGLWDDSRRAT